VIKTANTIHFDKLNSHISCIFWTFNQKGTERISICFGCCLYLRWATIIIG